MSCFFPSNKYWDVWKLNFNWTQCYLPSFPCVCVFFYWFLFFFQWEHKKRRWNKSQKSPHLVLWLSQWAVSFSDGKQIIFFKGLLTKEDQREMRECAVSIVVFVPLRFPLAVCGGTACTRYMSIICVSQSERKDKWKRNKKKKTLPLVQSSQIQLGIIQKKATEHNIT